METTFYEDARYSRGGLKRPATLDLNAVRSNKKPRGGALLTSPDLHMLKLESPELEKLIIQQHGLAGGGQCMYPRDEARDHQGCYPRDFPDALGGLQQQQPPHVNNFNLYQQPLQSDISLGNGMGLGMDYGYHPHPPQQAQQPSLDGQCNVVSSNGYPAPPPPIGYYSVEPVVSIKEEPQTVPCASPPDNPPRSPIDMEDQEKMKLERKRLRNRIAASKCRRRKLERIARLEDKVSHLKGENVELQGHVTRLKEHVCRLKQQVLDHVRSGCDILLYNEDL